MIYRHEPNNIHNNSFKITVSKINTFVRLWLSPFAKWLLDIVCWWYLVFWQMTTDLFTTSQASWTPLHIAASAGREDIVRSLISKGAQLNSVNQNGCTPLHYAASKDRYEVNFMVPRHLLTYMTHTCVLFFVLKFLGSSAYIITMLVTVVVYVL